MHRHDGRLLGFMDTLMPLYGNFQGGYKSGFNGGQRFINGNKD